MGKKRWKLEHSLIQGYKKAGKFSTLSHIHSITPLIIHICTKNKNTIYQISFLSSGVCGVAHGRVTAIRYWRNWITLTLGFMGPWLPVSLSPSLSLYDADWQRAILLINSNRETTQQTITFKARHITERTDGKYTQEGNQQNREQVRINWGLWKQMRTQAMTLKFKKVKLNMIGTNRDMISWSKSNREKKGWTAGYLFKCRHKTKTTFNNLILLIALELY